MHSELGPIGIISALSLLLPLPWHWRARNVATLSIIAWLFSINMIFAVDAFIWSDNVNIVAHVWCDITTKLIVGANFALPAACLCICIHLEQVASVRLTQSSYATKRRRQWFEAGMCFGLPAVFMILHYIVQGHRFDIIEGYGCRPATYFSIPAILIVWIPPILLSIVAIVFAGLALRQFMVRRLNFAVHLNSSNPALTPSRYIRLMTMASLQMVWSITVTSYSFYFTSLTLKIRPWTTWNDVHSDWLRVDVFTDSFASPFVKRSFYGMWWFIPISTFLFVVFFSFGKDAMDEYKKCFIWFGSKIFPINNYISPKKRESSSSSLPVFRKDSTQDLTSSNPMSITTTYSINVPPYDSFTPQKILPSFYDCESSFRSEVSNNMQKGEPKAIGSYADLSLLSPSVAGLSPTTTCNVLESDLEKPLPTPPPLTPPPPNPRLRPLLPNTTPFPSRPLTYPSFEAAQLSLHQSNTIDNPLRPPLFETGAA